MSMLKTNAVARSKRAQWYRRMVAIAAQYGLLQHSKTSAGAHKGRCANAVVIRGICGDVTAGNFYANLRTNIGPFPIKH